MGNLRIKGIAVAMAFALTAGMLGGCGGKDEDDILRRLLNGLEKSIEG